MTSLQPSIDYCLDLRELITLADLAQDQGTAIRTLLDTPALCASKRIYIGSSFCPQSLEHSLPLIDAAADVCHELDARLTLSLPIPAQRFLKHQDALVNLLLQRHAGIIDEIIANDLGTLTLLSERIHNAPQGDPFNDVTLVVGRLLCKDVRDPRNDDVSWGRRIPAYLVPGYEGENALQQLIATCSYWSDEHERYENAISGIELDPICVELDLSALPQGLLPVLNGPLCYMSTGQICEYASIGLPAQKAFRPNSACSTQCAKTSWRYCGASGVEFHKIGRSVFFQAPWQTDLQGVARYRQLISPLKEVRG